MRRIRGVTQTAGAFLASLLVACSSSHEPGASDGGASDAMVDGAPSFDGGPDAPEHDAAGDAPSRPDSGDGGTQLDAAPDAPIVDATTPDASPADASVDGSVLDAPISPDAAADASSGDGSGGSPDAGLDGALPGDAGSTDGTIILKAAVVLEGAATKGPFTADSGVTAILTDGFGALSGPVAARTTTGALGSFSAAVVPTDASAALVSATGQYWNEVLGRSSTSVLTLNSLVAISVDGGTKAANINVLTHLVASRVASGAGSATVPVGQAITNAETILFAALRDAGMAVSPGASASELALDGPTPLASGYLFAVSSIVAEMGLTASGDGGVVDDEVVRTISALTAEFTGDAGFSSPERTAFAAAQACVRPSAVTQSLTARVADSGVSLAIPNIDLALDTDGDGVVNAVDTCLLAANPVQANVPNAVCDFALQPAASQFVDDAGTFTLSGTTEWGAGDVDHSNGNDVVALTYAPAGTRLVVWLNHGDGTFAAPTGADVGALLGATGNKDPGLMSGQVIDIDHDGNLDLFVDYNGGLSVGYFKGNGHGAFPSFVSLAQLAADAGAGGFAMAAVGDLNGDGVMDVAGSGALANGYMDTAVSLVLSHADAGTWAAPVATSFSGIATTVSGISVADWNSDNKLDVVVGSSSGVFFLLGNGAGALAAPGSPWGAVVPLGMSVADFDRDGALDLLATTGTVKNPGPLVVAWGDHSLSPSAPLYTFNSSVTPLVCAPSACGVNTLLYGGSQPFVIGDATGDGKPDILAARSMAVLVSNGRSFTGPTGLAEVGDVCGAADTAPFVDVNGDGRADILALPHSGTTAFVPVLLNPANVHTW